MTNRIHTPVAAFVALALSASFAARADSIASQWKAPTMPASTAVVAGTAPIEQALSTIIPAPYRIALDESVPASAVIVWPAGDDWMKVLRAAVAPLDLVVVPDWKSNVIKVVRLGAAMPDRMPSPGPSASATESSAVSGSQVPGKAWPQLKPGSMPIYGADRMDPHGSAPGASAKEALSSAKKPVHNAGGVPDEFVAEEGVSRGTYVIPAGTMLSDGLSQYVKQYGWTMRWNVPEKYRLDAPLPIPAKSIRAGITYVLRAYQARNGLLGDRAVFSTPNNVVSIQPIEVEVN